MMVVSVIITVLSCIIQGIMSNYLGYTYTDLSWFSTIYILIALLVVRPYFFNEKKYLIMLVVSGLVMDIVYTNVFVLNACLFACVYFFSKSFHFFFPYNCLTINVSNLLGIFLYHVMSFILLTVLGYDNYTVDVLLTIFSHSVIMTIIYTSIIYGLVLFLQRKFEFREVK